MSERSKTKTGDVTQRLQAIQTARGPGGAHDIVKLPPELEGARCHDSTEQVERILRRILNLSEVQMRAFTLLVAFQQNQGVFQRGPDQHYQEKRSIELI